MLRKLHHAGAAPSRVLNHDMNPATVAAEFLQGLHQYDVANGTLPLKKQQRVWCEVAVNSQW
jgi:hypothetical protein